MKFKIQASEKLAILKQAAEGMYDTIRIGAGDLAAFAIKAAERSEFNQKGTPPGGTAFIDIRGPLVEGPDWLEWFGYCSYERIRREAFEAEVNGNVTSVILRINSPGGMVSGCFETQQVLSGLSKPIIEARVEAQATSAAYLLASTADKIVAGGHSTLGSIGCILQWFGNKKMLEAMGISRKTFVSSVSPAKNDDPEDVGEEGEARIQKHVNDLGKFFVERVAELRGITPEKVLANYGQGGVFVGKEALSQGLADEIVGLAKQPEQTGATTMSKELSDLALLNGELPSAEADAAADDGESQSTDGEEYSDKEQKAADAVAAEVARMKAIDDEKIVGFDALVHKAKYGAEKATVEQLKAWVYDEQKARKGKGAGGITQEAAKRETIRSASAEEAARIEDTANLRRIAKEALKQSRGW